MVLGIPRGCFYYDYYGFISRLFASVSDDIQVVFGEENDDDILGCGIRAVVDEACLPIKLMAGQIEKLGKICDKILIPRITKDFKGRWLCPKLLGLPELLSQTTDHNKLMITEPIRFDNKKATAKSFWNICQRAGMTKKQFRDNFEAAYGYQKDISCGKTKMHVEAAWEFTPQVSEDEIILPNLGKVLLLGHSYNVYDKFSNGNIMEKLDELGLEVITERAAGQNEKEEALSRLDLLKAPFWESFVRMMGTAVIMKDKVEGIIYLSSFSCGLDAFIIDMIKNNISEIPFMVMKLDEHKGSAGFDTRLEAFADLLERKRVS